ncbi:MAG: DUF4340 domain-containing protein [Nitrospinaceae bacterium]
MKRFAGTLGLALVLAGLAAYYYLIDLPQEQKERADKDRSQRVLFFDPKDVEGLLYQHGETTIRAKKENDVWRLQAPQQEKADANTIGALLADLKDARILRVVEEKPADLAAFGLASPRVKLTVQLKDAGETSVLFGDRAPVGPSLYVKLADEERVLLVPTRIQDWEKTLFDFRGKTILDYFTPEVTGVDLVRPANTLHLAREKDVWKLSGAVQALGDKSNIEDLLNSIRYSRIQAFAENPADDPARFGLDAPSRKLTLHFKDKTRELWIGGEVGGNFHATRPGEAKVFQVEKRLVDLLDTPYIDLMEKSLVSFKNEQVTRLEIQSPEQTLSLVRDPKDKESWLIKTPINTRADTAAVNSLLFDLADAKVLEFVKADDPEVFGLTSPTQRLTLFLDDGRKEHVSLGNKNLDGARRYATRSQDQTVFALGKTTVDKLFRTLHDLRDRRLLPSLAADKVQFIVIKASGTTYELSREGKLWNLLRPEPVGPLKEHLGNDILWTLNHLEFEKEIKAGEGKDRSVLSPVLTVTVLDENRVPLAKVEVGAKIKDKKLHTTKVSGKEGVFQIKERFLKEIPSDLEAFRLALVD